MVPLKPAPKIVLMDQNLKAVSPMNLTLALAPMAPLKPAPKIVLMVNHLLTVQQMILIFVLTHHSLIPTVIATVQKDNPVTLKNNAQKIIMMAKVIAPMVPK